MDATPSKWDIPISCVNTLTDLAVSIGEIYGQWHMTGMVDPGLFSNVQGEGGTVWRANRSCILKLLPGGGDVMTSSAKFLEDMREHLDYIASKMEDYRSSMTPKHVEDADMHQLRSIFANYEEALIDDLGKY